MRPLRAILAFFLAAALLAAACSRREKADTSIYGSPGTGLHDTLALLNEYSNSGRYSDFLTVALPLYMKAVQSGNDTGQVFFGSGLAEAYSRLDMPDSALTCLDRILPIALRLDNRDALLMIYNTYGLYSLYYRMNYNEAVDCFMKALSYADTLNGGLDNYLRIVNNLAHTHNLRQDTLGLRYSLEVYRKGRQYANDYWLYIGAINTATQYCLRGDYSRALVFIDEAMPLTSRYHSVVEVYYLYADIMAGLGRRAEAERYYQKALAVDGDVETAVRCGLYSSYGDFLMQEGRWEDAAAMYSNGIESAKKAGSYMYLYELYLGLSRAYGRMGDLRGELENYKMYHYLSDSVFNYEKERAMSEMMVKYETEKKERLLQQQEVQLVQKSRRLTVSVLVIIILLVVVTAILLLYFKRQEMYKQLVRRHYEKYKLERQLLEKEAARPVTDNDRLRSLFEDISSLMQKQKVYRDSSLTVESLARMLDTNRTYVSSAINQFAGMTFKDYVNSLRVSEAVSILSDPDKDVPLKAMFSELGFNSSSTFYRVFQNATGVPPSRYRKESRRIKEEEIS